MKKLVVLSTKPLFLVILLIIALGVAGANYYMYQNSKMELAKVKSNPQLIAQDEAKALIAKVGALVLLPASEDPTVATITDKEKLKEQPFFARAENGDKVLIFTQAKKAYLYSPKLNKVLEIAPVNIGTNNGQVAGVSTSPTQAPKK